MPDLPASKLDEMEAKARAAKDATTWSYDGEETILTHAGVVADLYGDPARCQKVGEHIAAFDPPHALALIDMARGKIAAEAKLSALLDEHDKVNALLTGYMGLLTKARARATHAERVRDRLVAAINWATGAGDSDFGDKIPIDAKRYWWRVELTKRAGLTYDSQAGVYALAEIKERG